MNNAGGAEASRKFPISVISLITGLLLFAASFSMLLNNTAFNSKYYEKAFEEFGTYSLITELAGNPAKDLTSKISASSESTALSIEEADSVIDQQKTLMNSLVEDNVSDKMVRLNVDSLIEGLLSYFKGETGSLPDLHLTGSAALKSVNLQVFVMYMGENSIWNVLHLVSLYQYLLVHIPIFLLFLFPFIFAYMLKKSPGVIQYWLLKSAFFYCVFSMTAGLLIQLLPYILIKNIFIKNFLSKIDLLQPSLSGLLTNHVFHLTNVLTFYTLLSGTLLYLGVHAALQANTRFINYKKNGALSFSLLFSKKRTIFVLAIVLVSASIFYVNLQSSKYEFYHRNLGQTLAQLWKNNPIYRVTDAHNDLVYLLEIHMVDSNTKKPLANVGINIENSSGQNTADQPSFTATDSAGTATYLLDKGSYTLTLDSYNMLAGFGDAQLYSCRFEMLTPGKSELTVVLTQKKAGLPYLDNASLQFIP
jgi:hypothetical protein